ncbi:hypothetical protein ABT095_20970 [Kitasatospora sp. NPDC002227]|uniref:hypothetical protein n=1 Tax=Kitasatospora sp. NPDC002227 TaxID=3154773 RepID=UPI003319AE3F
MRARADRGAISIFVALSVAGLVLVAVGVLDACARLRTVEATDALAQEAARAVGQQLDQAALLGGTYRVDQSAAQQAADDYLHAQDPTLTGDVTFIDDSTVAVTVRKSYRIFLLGKDVPVISTRTATLVHGVTKPENG